jgi:TM2 domain-containing membrane protein YozV
MSKKVLWLIIIFTILFIIGVNTGELAYLMNLGNTI